MIMGDRFVWLHFPKCSGTETERILRTSFGNNSSIAFDPIDLTNVIWHHSIKQRCAYDPAFSLGDRAVICNIRRLPSWLLSRIHFEYWRSPQFKVTREMLVNGEVFEANGLKRKADFYAAYYSDPAVTYWIRTESLSEDIRAVFSKFLDFSNIDVQSQIKHVNSAKVPYINNLEFFFTNSDLDKLYAANPVWAAIEKEVYGDILRF